jgi:hypothetical protein
LGRRIGVHHVDVDRMVLDLLDHGERPDPEHGWLEQVENEIRRAVSDHSPACVEATGAWDSDWMLAEHLRAAGCRVLPVWVTAPLEVTLDRLTRRRSRKVPASPQEPRWIHAEATRRAATRSFNSRRHTSADPAPAANNPAGAAWPDA